MVGSGIKKCRKQGIAIVWQGMRGADRSTGIQFKSPAHKGKECIPRIEQEVFQQSFDMLKKLAALAQLFSQQLVLFIHQAHDGVKEKSQQVQTEQQGGKELCAVSEIVFQMIAFGFQNIVVLVFDVSTSSTTIFQRARPSRAMAATVVSSTSKSVTKAFL